MFKSHSCGECPICYINLTKKNSYKTTCNHLFCNKCKNDMSNRNIFNCPVCRAEMIDLKSASISKNIDVVILEMKRFVKYPVAFSDLDSFFNFLEKNGIRIKCLNNNYFLGKSLTFFLECIKELLYLKYDIHSRERVFINSYLTNKIEEGITKYSNFRNIKLLMTEKYKTYKFNSTVREIVNSSITNPNNTYETLMTHYNNQGYV